VLFKKFGIEVKFITSDEPEAFAAAIDGNTKAIFVESIGNPKYNVSPISEIAKVRTTTFHGYHVSDRVVLQIAQEHRIPLIVDNTFGMGGTPYLLLATDKR
jgi:O-acetylhomoserine/O-acetylserine sulfhydrylase